MANGKLTFPEFPPQTKALWEARIEKELKGKPRTGLHWQPGADILLDAMYRQEDLSETYSAISRLETTNQWSIGEVFRVENPKTTQQQLQQALLEGVQAPSFIFPQTPSLSDLEQLFKDVELTYISTHLSLANTDIWPGELMTTFLTLVQFRDQTPRTLTGSFGYDPLAHQQTPDWGALAIWLKHCIDVLPGFRILTVDLSDLSQGPEGIVQELSQALIRTNLLIAHLSEQGIPVDIVQNLLQFKLGIGKEYLAEIAKIRTLRLLIEQLYAAYGLDQPTPILIETHFAPQTYGEDPNTNRIRATTLAMSAIIGGTDRLYVQPAISPELPSDEAFARRLGRNLQHLLTMESHLDRVIDPAAGSYYLESMTNQFGERAWDDFRNQLNS